MKGVPTMNKKNFWDMTKEEQEALLGKTIKEEITKHHAAGRPTVHGDDKGVYLIHPDGTKEYVDLYSVPDMETDIHHDEAACR